MYSPRKSNQKSLLRHDDRHVRLYDPNSDSVDPFEQTDRELDEIQLLNLVKFLEDMVRPSVIID
jgi:hypothetical protein